MALRIDFLSDLIAELKAVSKPEYKEFAARMIPSKQNILGIRTPDMRKVLKDFYPEIKDLPFIEFFDLMYALKATDIFECAMLSNEFIDKNKQFNQSLSATQINQLLLGLDNWALVDSFAIYVSGPTWINKQLDCDDILKWSNHKDQWIRRLALVSTVPLNRKSEPELWKRDFTFKLCEKHLSDPEMIIHKAISWALRSMVKYWSNDVLDFVDAHKCRFKPFVEREVVNKIKTGKKM